jgi:hypothetical protein
MSADGGNRGKLTIGEHLFGHVSAKTGGTYEFTALSAHGRHNADLFATIHLANRLYNWDKIGVRRHDDGSVKQISRGIAENRHGYVDIRLFLFVLDTGVIVWPSLLAPSRRMPRSRLPH